MKKSPETHLSGCDKDRRSESLDHGSRRDSDGEINESVSLINFLHVVESNTDVKRFSGA